ncbi:MAG: hypothetical protein HRT61_00615 [Ekhidna sp.]|nr:hypothetical protein [Ekhidna sp.]
MWDNKEDGDGNVWLKEHRPNLADKWWTEYYWKAIRNPAWNMRYVRWCSLSALPEHVTDIRFEGNTFHKSFRYSHASMATKTVVRERIWFKFSAVVDGKRRYCEFELVPISATESRAKYKGWKFYPHLYLDKYWLERIANEGWPRYKDRLVYTNSNRVQEM